MTTKNCPNIYQQKTHNPSLERIESRKIQMKRREKIRICKLASQSPNMDQ